VDQLLEKSLLAAVETLDSLQLKYAVVGGLAVSAWARPRSTRDVDLYAEIPEGFEVELQHGLEDRGFHVPALSEELQQYGVFRSKHRASGVFLDIFSATGPLGEAILEHRRKIVLDSHELWLISAENLVLLKAFSDRPRDFEDLVMLYGNGPTLDQAYIDHWTRMLDESIGTTEVAERIQRARTRGAGTT
jgi:hypothetical protein